MYLIVENLPILLTRSEMFLKLQETFFQVAFPLLIVRCLFFQCEDANLQVPVEQ